MNDGLDEKYLRELSFWRCVNDREHGFGNQHYRDLMLAVADTPEETFNDAVVADFGCGPRGSLAWLTKAKARIGIDVLAGAYFDKYRFQLEQHRMIYVQSSEHCIPLSSDTVDVLFTINSLDHVLNLEMMCREIVRIIKPHGCLFGSFNIMEPPTVTEPQMLTPGIIGEYLLKYFDVIEYHVGEQEEGENRYVNMLNKKYGLPEGHRGLLWVTAQKK